LKALGLLSLGSVETIAAGALLGARLEDTRMKTMHCLNSARGCVLFIDHAHVLNDHSLGSAVFAAIVDFCRNGRDSDTAILLSGDPNGLEVMLRLQDPGLSHIFSFDQGLYCIDLNENELCSCVIKLADEFGLEFSLPSVNVAMKILLEYKSRPHFANYDSVRRVVSSSAARMRSRVSTSSALEHTTTSSSSMVVTPGDVLKESSDYEAQLYNMKSINTQLSEALVRLKLNSSMTHFIFLGASGAGHSTIAGLLAEQMQQLGLAARSSVVEINALTIIGDSNTDATLELESVLLDAKGGVLLINDAHEFMCSALGFAAFNKLVGALHAAEENQTFIILSGLESLMKDIMARQPGLLKRFANIIRLPAWSADVCVDFIIEIAREDGLGLEAQAVEVLRRGFEILQERPSWSHVRDVIDVYLDLTVARLTRIRGFHSSSDMVGWREGVVVPLITFADADAVMRHLISSRPRDPHPCSQCAAALATNAAVATGHVGYAERQARLRFDRFCKTLEETQMPLALQRPDLETTSALADSANASSIVSVNTEKEAASEPKLAAATGAGHENAAALDAKELSRNTAAVAVNSIPSSSTAAQLLSQPHLLVPQKQKSIDYSRLRLPSIHGIRTPSANTLIRRSSSAKLQSELGVTSDLSESENEEDLASILSDAEESDNDEGLLADFNKLEADANVAQDDFAREWNALSEALNEISSPASVSVTSQELMTGMSFGPGNVELPDIDEFDESASFVISKK
jgi:hypothetical protein